MMSLGRLIFVQFLLCSLLTVPAVYAERTEAGKEAAVYSRMEKKQKKMQEIYRKLNLSEEQKKLLDDNKAKSRQKRKASFEQIRSYKKALHEELMKTDLGMEKIGEIQANLKKLQADMIDDRLESILEVRNILTPEQFSEFINLMDQHKWKSSDKKERE